MNSKIIILNCVRYKAKESNEIKGIITFAFCDEQSISNTENMKGYVIGKIFTRNDLFFKTVSSDVIGKVVDATLEERSRFDNPLIKQTIIRSINYKGTVYDIQ